MRRTLILVLVSLTLVFGAWRLSKSRSVQLFGELVTRVETDERVVALTLDDGPSTYGTEATLALLDSLDVRATLFVTGAELDATPDLGADIVRRGHELGNHSYTHAQMVLKSPGWVLSELDRTDAAIRRAGHTGTIHFRPPYGKRLVVLPWILARTDRSTILWDVEPETFLPPEASGADIAAHTVERVQPGSIVLLHTMYASRDASRNAIPLIVDELRARGYRFVTVSELLALRS